MARKAENMEKIFMLYIMMGILLFLANCIFTGIISIEYKNRKYGF